MSSYLPMVLIEITCSLCIYYLFIAATTATTHTYTRAPLHQFKISSLIMHCNRETIIKYIQCHVVNFNSARMRWTVEFTDCAEEKCFEFCWYNMMNSFLISLCDSFANCLNSVQGVITLILPLLLSLFIWYWNRFYLLMLKLEII